MGTFLIVAGVLLLVVGIGLYNGLVRRRNRVTQAYAGIEVQLTQRYDLIPKLVETVRQYMGHERSVLENVVRLRNEALASTTPESRMRADAQLSQALGALRVTVENYPELRASENFVHLQRSLNEVEEQLAAARRSYNAAVADYNDAVQTFPGNVVAGMGSFAPMPSFAAEEHKRGDVDMKQLFQS